MFSRFHSKPRNLKNEFETRSTTEEIFSAPEPEPEPSVFTDSELVQGQVQTKIAFRGHDNLQPELSFKNNPLQHNSCMELAQAIDWLDYVKTILAVETVPDNPKRRNLQPDVVV